MIDNNKFDIEQIIFIRTLYEYVGPSLFRNYSLSRKRIKELCEFSRDNYVKYPGESYYYNMTLWLNDIGLAFLSDEVKLLFLCRAINSKIFCADLIKKDFIDWLIGKLSIILYDDEFLIKQGDCILKALEKLYLTNKASEIGKHIERLSRIKNKFHTDTFIIA